MRFHYNKTILSLALSFFFLQGCAKTASFSPSKDGEMLHFTATIPDELEALPLYAMYRSEICRKESRTANMKSYTVPGYHRERYPLAILSPNKIEASIPKFDEGKCDWKLSNIVFEIKLKDPTKVDPLISDNLGKKITFVLDDNAPAAFDGGYEKRSGDINEQLILFPLIIENFVGGHDKSFWLIARYETMTYKSKKSKNININIDYKSNMKTYRIGIKKPDNGESPKFIYPNGVQEKTNWLFPEYKKLVEILEFNDKK
ncbi:hypothetical protein [Providencia manganoxydans]|uniref:hypothetical protein n=1 Tax=Providencia manganoxydans TaxID=2923283 RepID=UPI0034E41210